MHVILGGITTTIQTICHTYLAYMSGITCLKILQLPVRYVSKMLILTVDLLICCIIYVNVLQININMS